MSLTKRKSPEATEKEKIKIKTEARKGTKWRERRKRKEKKSSLHTHSLYLTRNNTKVVINVVNLVIKILKVPWGPLIYLF